MAVSKMLTIRCSNGLSSRVRYSLPAQTGGHKASPYTPFVFFVPLCFVDKKGYGSNRHVVCLQNAAISVPLFWWSLRRWKLSQEEVLFSSHMRGGTHPLHISAVLLFDARRLWARNQTHGLSGFTSHMPWWLPPQAPLRVCLGQPDSGHGLFCCCPMSCKWNDRPVPCGYRR